MSLNPSERRILVVTSFAHFLSHYNMLVFPAVVLPLAGSLHMEMAKVVGLSFWMYLLFGLTALPWGIIGDRLGGKPLMLVMFLGAGISGLLAALFMDSPTGLVIALAGIGLFSGIYHPIGLGLISKGVGRLSLAMGYNAVFGGLGLAVAPLVTGVVTWMSGPKAAYVVLGGLNLLGLGLMAFMPLAETEHTSHGKADEGNGMVGAFLILLVAMMLGGIAYRGSTVILPAFLELKGKGIYEALNAIGGGKVSSNLVATAVASVVYLVGMVGQYVGGHVGERYDNRYAYLVFHSICIPAAFLIAVSYDLALASVCFVYFFFLLGMQPVENTLVASFTPRRLHHSAYGMKFILTFGVGALAVKMVEYIDASWGIAAIYTALGFVSIILVADVCLLIYWTSRPAGEPRHGVATMNRQEIA